MTASDDQVLAFVRAAKALPMEDASIVAMLRQAGWSERRIYAAIGSYYETALGTAIPQRGSRTEYAREAFLYLVSFITLGIWATALGHLCYVLIDHRFPDVTSTSFAEPLRDAVSWDIASIVVAFPIYVLSMWSIGKGVAQRPEAVESGVRSWLTYIALVVTTVVVVGDLVLFLATFLRGALTTPFALKSAVVIAIAGAIGWYYLGTVQTVKR